MRKGFVLAAAVLALAAGIPSALGGAQADPGVTAKLITIGGTFPLTGPASSYAPIPRGMAAYFSYINARKGPDGKRGVGGRQVKFIFYDDAYNPAQTVQQTRRLVEQDKVFALVGGLGTEPQEPIRGYLNANKVPQVYVSTGATLFDAEYADFPWTIGWQPDYQAEGAVYGKYVVANAPNAKIAILYQNDAYGRDYIAGFENGLRAKKSQIIATRGYNVTEGAPTSQLLDLRRTGADTLVLFSTPTKTIQSYAVLRAIGWKPSLILLNSVSATDTFMSIAVRSSSPATVNGSISIQYLKDPAAPEWANDAGMKLYLEVMKKYLPDARVTDGLYFYGMAKAHSFVVALYAAGKNPTREGLMKAVRSMNDKNNPFVLPGMVVRTTPKDPYPISQMRLIEYQDGTWKAVGPLINGRGK